MSSGSYATKAGFREDQKPNSLKLCPTARYEDRGPGLLLTGCCRICGGVTTETDTDGHPCHQQIPAIIQ